jgi:hypothetical protein
MPILFLFIKRKKPTDSTRGAVMNSDSGSNDSLDDIFAEALNAVRHHQPSLALFVSATRTSLLIPSCHASARTLLLRGRTPKSHHAATPTRSTALTPSNRYRSATRSAWLSI